jgi:hypothetical protein
MDESKLEDFNGRLFDQGKIAKDFRDSNNRKGSSSVIRSSSMIIKRAPANEYDLQNAKKDSYFYQG